MTLANATQLEAVDVPIVDHEGRDVVVVIAKATYEVGDDGELVPAEEPSPVRLADEPWDDAETSSLRYASDVCTAKRGVDVLVIGEAWSPQPVAVIDVGIAVGDRTTALRVHGPRCYYRGLTGMAIGSAANFERLQLRWEYAYGGSSKDLSVVDLRNPVGVGVTNDTSLLVDQPAPRIEHPARPHASTRDDHAPVGCAPVMTHWAPRRDWFGTCDASWQKTRMPLPPTDFDLRFNNVAPDDLQFDQLPAGTAIRVLGMSENLVQFRVPELGLVVRGLFDQGDDDVKRPAIDTIIIEPGRRRVEVAARACFPAGRGRRVLREIRMDAGS